MTAAELKTLLGLVPHPCEGGHFIQTYAAPETVALGRYPSPRRTSTAIYYLLEPGTFSEMHRLKSDEVFHFYAGDPVEMLQLRNGAAGCMVVIGNDLANGERPQIIVERDVWQGSRLRSGGQWALLGCTVSPGFEYEDYETADRTKLAAQWPHCIKMIHALTH